MSFIYKDGAFLWKSFSYNRLLAKKSCYIVTLVPCYVVINKRRWNEIRFNDSQNKGYLYATSLIGRKEGNSY